MNALKNAVALAGGQTALARLIGVKQAHVWNWLQTGRVPAERCIQIEKATHGAVLCEDLRPDIEWAVVRGAQCQGQKN